GRAAILFPHGVLFRDMERDMREGIIKDDWIEAVIGLGPNLFYNSGMESCVVVLRASKPEARRGNVILIDASDLTVQLKNHAYVSEEQIERVVAAYEEPEAHEDLAVVVSLDSVADNDYSLHLPLYIDSGTKREVDVGAAIECWQASRES